MLLTLALDTLAGIYIFQLIDWYIAAFAVTFFGVLECIIYGWIYVNGTCSDGIQWVWHILGDCITDEKGVVSLVFGIASLLTWMIYVAIYFVAADIVLFMQYIYYQLKTQSNMTITVSFVFCWLFSDVPKYGNISIKIPQFKCQKSNIKDEFKRKSTYGLSILMFVLAFIGNVTYGLSILVRQQNEAFPNTTFTMACRKSGTNFDIADKMEGFIVIDTNSRTEDITDTSEYERETWSRKIQYLLSMVGYCVGLGNIWRFSYICLRNRGGAFLIPFLFFLITCGMSLYFFEVSIGQFLGGGVVYISEVAPIFRGLGFGMLVISVICAFYYNNITSWILYYLVNSFFNPLPWSTCGNSWNSKDCVNERYNAFSHMTGNANLSSLQSDLTILTRNSSDNTTRINNHFVTSEEEFWERQVLQMSSGLHDMVTSLGIFWFVIWQLGLSFFYGVKSAGKVTATLPYLLLTVLIIRGLTLPGGIDGIAYYLKPNFLRLLDKQVWLEAALQVFYSLGPCWGGLITMSSYLKFSNNCLRYAHGFVLFMIKIKMILSINL
ncbi:hypothetical protein KUTeg_010580 [Tegillarca granosa]|uniref:Uncharacterized protein n=1 Tax=Tegillarca granosa TaxID=220873 RepID=A0ABQ9F5L3_TEGGR|nr:hypothetical protein KUTeg_010580 [Tegillarca granosa]